MNLSILKNFLGGSIGGALKDVKDAVLPFIPDARKKDFDLQIAKIEAESKNRNDSFVLEMKDIELKSEAAQMDMAKTVINSDNSQDDKYVKRARPTVIYSGLIIIFLEMFGLRALILSAIAHKFALKFESIAASSDSVLNMFFIAWTGIVGVYGYGRSKEKIATKKADIFNKTGEVISTGKAIKDMIKW